MAIKGVTEYIPRLVAMQTFARRMHQRCMTPFDPSNKEQEQQLIELWDLIFPLSKCPARYGDHWMGLGFQGRDPATDFRGMGMLGLDQLRFFARLSQAAAVVSVRLSVEEPFYLWAITGINITSVLVALLPPNPMCPASRPTCMKHLVNMRPAMRSFLLLGTFPPTPSDASAKTEQPSYLDMLEERLHCVYVWIMCRFLLYWRFETKPASPMDVSLYLRKLCENEIPFVLRCAPYNLDGIMRSVCAEVVEHAPK